MNDFTPERSDAIRAGLVDAVEADRPRRRRGVWGAALVLAGVLAGAGASAGAFAATGLLVANPPAQPAGQPTPAAPDAVIAPDDVIPGTPLTTLIGEAISLPFTAELQVPLQRPATATHARVTITALTPGKVVWGTDPGGNNPQLWMDADDESATTWYDFPLDASVDTLYLEPTALEGIVTVQYITMVPTLYKVNANGETYGSGDPYAGELDLVAVSGRTTDGSDVQGYARVSDLTAFSPDHPGEPKTPEQALEWQNELAEIYPDGWTVPVYESDGVTVIGKFQVGG